MAIIKCKMCGGDMEISADQRCGTCEYCGSTMTLPKVDDEQRAAAFNRGNYFRRIGEFDKALLVYERIVQEDETDAEAHWCCALCRFGIEYVQDPASREYLPTCHRASFDSFLEDVDYKAALEHADPVARGQYEKDGEKIAQVQRGILSVSQKEQPFDVFICYKESDDQGNRTVDSTLAQEIYYHLTDAGYRVFFSRITLEDKAGQAYEPYIFAALHSVKVMVVIGTKPEYLNAVWVKNEWSRYLAIIKKDRKKLLIPCYRDMDPYDMPEQLSVLQSYDMSKIGFIQDLIRGISKVIVKEAPVLRTAAEPAAVPSEPNGNLTALLKRGYMALEDQEWSRADNFFEQVLNLDAECGEAFFGKYLAEERLASIEDFIKQELNLEIKSQKVHLLENELKEFRNEAVKETTQNNLAGYLNSWVTQDMFEPFSATYQSEALDIQKHIEQSKNKLSAQAENRLLARAFRYATGNFAVELNEAKKQILESLVDQLVNAQQKDAKNEEQIIENFERYKQQSLEKAHELLQLAREKQEENYRKAVSLQRLKKYTDAEIMFSRIKDYKDSKKRIEQCRKLVDRRKKKTAAIVIALIVLAAVSLYLYSHIVVPGRNYQSAETLLAEGDYAGAAAAFVELGDYKDAAERVLAAKYSHAESLLKQKDYAGATIAFMQVEGYLDAEERGSKLWNQIAQRSFIAVGYRHSIGLKSDGTVVAVGDNYDGKCDISDWRDIVAVAAGSENSLGLKSNGIVVAAGNNKDGQCNVSDWRSIVAVAAGNWHSIGLKSNGTVVAVGNNEADQCDVSDWCDIVAVAAGNGHSVGLKSDGTVVAVGNNDDGQCDVSDWRDIVAIAAGNNNTVGLRSDSIVVAVGNNDDGQCDISDWQDITAVAARCDHIIGLKSDGTVVAVGRNEFGQCDVSAWIDIRLPAQAKEE